MNQEAMSAVVLATLLLSLSVAIATSIGVFVVAKWMSDINQREYEESKWVPGDEPDEAEETPFRP